MTQVFLLTNAITAVKVDGPGLGPLCSLPVDEEIRLTENSGPEGFVEITCKNETYLIFRVDLMARPVSRRSMSAAA